MSESSQSIYSCTMSALFIVAFPTQNVYTRSWSKNKSFWGSVGWGALRMKRFPCVCGTKKADLQGAETPKCSHFMMTHSPHFLHVVFSAPSGWSSGPLIWAPDAPSRGSRRSIAGDARWQPTRVRSRVPAPRSSSASIAVVVPHAAAFPPARDWSPAHQMREGTHERLLVTKPAPTGLQSALGRRSIVPCAVEHHLRAKFSRFRPHKNRWRSCYCQGTGLF